MNDTIFALSSGSVPAALAIIRISGPGAAMALTALAGRLPSPRRASLARLLGTDGEILDEALILWFPGPDTATGEDLAELHCHGGRAVVAAVEAALAALYGLRRAEPGEFTRRAFINGRIDLAQAEGLADLLESETELQRQAALALSGGALSRTVEAWRERLLRASAQIEALLDFGDEDDVADLSPNFLEELPALAADLHDWIGRPRAEVLRQGFRVVIAGPPNAGKSTLFNALVEAEAAITAPIAGTTRDVLTRPIALAGIPFLFADTAGLRDDASEDIEAIGIARAKAELNGADLVLWLGDEGQGPAGAWEIEAQCDRPVRSAKCMPRHRLSAISGEGLAGLRTDLVQTARLALPKPGAPALNARQHERLTEASLLITEATQHSDPLLTAESLRRARLAFDGLIGKAATEDMLDALFGRFCIGK